MKVHGVGWGEQGAVWLATKLLRETHGYSDLELNIHGLPHTYDFTLESMDVKSLDVKG